MFRGLHGHRIWQLQTSSYADISKKKCTLIDWTIPKSWRSGFARRFEILLRTCFVGWRTASIPVAAVLQKGMFTCWIYFLKINFCYHQRNGILQIHVFFAQYVFILFLKHIAINVPPCTKIIWKPNIRHSPKKKKKRKTNVSAVFLQQLNTVMALCSVAAYSVVETYWSFDWRRWFHLQGGYWRLWWHVPPKLSTSLPHYVITLWNDASFTSRILKPQLLRTCKSLMPDKNNITK
jgi:hypothetical protein